MGWFDDLKKKANKTLGLGENNDLFRIGAALGTGGMSELAIGATGGSESGGLTDILLGKKNVTKADAIAGNINAAKAQGISSAQKGMTDLNSALDMPSGNIVREQVERQKKGVLASAQDARREAQKLMARRGLQGSSLGLASNRSITQNTGNQMASIDAATPGLIRNQSIKDAMTRLQAGSGLYSSMGGQAGVQMKDQDHGRSGGILGIASALAPVAGTVAGFAMGGPAGAAMGSQLGGGIGSALGQQQQGAYSPSRYSMGNYQF